MEQVLKLGTRLLLRRGAAGSFSIFSRAAGCLLAESQIKDDAEAATTAPTQAYINTSRRWPEVGNEGSALI